MIKVLFTSDYEIHGNGEGSPKALMVDTTYRMMDQFDKYGAKLTILADVAEILKFCEHFLKTGKDDFNYKDVEIQLQYAIKTGHDVQLHIHSSYYNAKFENGRWKSDWSEYNLANLSFERQKEVIAEGKLFLEEILKPVNPEYNCFVFRAANWSMLPSENITRALIENDIRIDTSVFKFGKRNGMVNFDYTSAFSDTLAWPANPGDVRKRKDGSRLFEFPIYCEEQSILNFFSVNRLYRVLQSRLHNFKDSEPFQNQTVNGEERSSKPSNGIFTKLNKKYAMKADFNQCTGRQLINQLQRVEKKYGHLKIDIPFVTIGHSKLFTKFNEQSLKPFLKFVTDNPEKYSFGKYADFDLNSFEKINLVPALNEFD